MADVSSSSASSGYLCYDVFINHRGRDVKDTFATSLYRRLTSCGLRVFLDKPEMQAGHSITCQIEAAIRAASVQVAIFSETYAQSKWCLDELVLMLKSGKIILPVFYKVKPCDLRYGAYAEDLRKLEQKRTYNPETHQQKKPRYSLDIIEDWRNALSRAADISGFVLEECHGDEQRAEQELLDQVVQNVVKKIKKTLDVAEHPTGLGEKLQDFESKVLSREEKQRMEAKIVGIVGTGGIGKTTLAKEFFNRKRSDYSGSSFLFYVREKATTKSLNDLQSKLIKDLKGKDIKIQTVEEGVDDIKKDLASCHALIILDDVGHRDQLNAFLPIKHVLRSDSLIVVTSRDNHVLQSAGIEESSIYELTVLNRHYSKELFCLHAFLQRQPLPGFEILVDRFLTACCGLPLALKVFGALVCRHDQSYWEDQLDGLRQTQTLPTDIEKSLQISYDSLNPEEQQIFLDIACFCIGKDRDTWITIWSGSGWKGFAGFRNLQDKCLVYIDSENKIRMHDLLRDLGRSIVNSSVSMPRRIWGAMRKEVHDLLAQSSSVMTEVRGITMSSKWKPEMPLIKNSGQYEASGIRKLRLLEGEGDFVKRILTWVRSPNLLWLCWNLCPCSSLPSWIPMYDLRVLEVSGRNLERLWERESQAPLQLRELTIRYAPLLEFPKSLGKLMHLQRIVVHSTELATLPEEFCCLRSLKYLEVSGRNLKRLWEYESRSPPQLRELTIRYAPLLEFPKSLWQLMHLQRIVVHSAQLATLPEEFCYLRSLKYLELSECLNLHRLPDSFGNLTNLHHLDLNHCEILERLPNSFGNLTNLQDVNLYSCQRLKALPDSCGNLTKLESISLHNCKSLERLPNSLRTLTNLQSINLDKCINLSPDSFLNLPNFHSITLNGSGDFKVLPHFQGPKHFPIISLHGCRSLKMLPDCCRNSTRLQKIIMNDFVPDCLWNWINLQSISMNYCENLKMLPDSLGNLISLQSININGCKRLEMLPESFGNLTNLRDINLKGCTSLKKLPDSFGNLLQLQHLHLGNCSSLTVSNKTLRDINRLECLALSGCIHIEVLPSRIGCQQFLKRLNLLGTNLKEMPIDRGCLNNLDAMWLGGPSLEALPTSFSNLTSLQNLTLCNSPKLKCLPDSIGLLAQLRGLRIWNCGIQYLPQDLMKMNNLRSLHISKCPLNELPFKKVGEERGAHIGMLQLKELKLKQTEISEVSFPEGVCPYLEYLSIECCNNPVEVTALPTALITLHLRNCSALTKIGGLCSLSKLPTIDIKGCNNLQEEELADIRTPNVLKEELEIFCDYFKDVGEDDADKYYGKILLEGLAKLEEEDVDADVDAEEEAAAAAEDEDDYVDVDDDEEDDVDVVAEDEDDDVDVYVEEEEEAAAAAEDEDDYADVDDEEEEEDDVDMVAGDDEDDDVDVYVEEEEAEAAAAEDEDDYADVDDEDEDDDDDIDVDVVAEQDEDDDVDVDVEEYEDEDQEEEEVDVDVAAEDEVDDVNVEDAAAED